MVLLVSAAECCLRQVPERENLQGEKKVLTENKTISEDTKALVKQALLSHRQRTGSFSDFSLPHFLAFLPSHAILTSTLLALWWSYTFPRIVFLQFLNWSLS